MHNRFSNSIRICDLPDPILQLILSSLPIKDAIRTSVLSKRWEHLWMGISKIMLKQEGTYEKRKQFAVFMRRLLEVFDCTNLEKFSLSCHVGEIASEVNEWLSGFINPKIQELTLYLNGVMEFEKTLTFPDHLFTCSTLTTFGLRMQNVLKLPSSIYFKSLRTLYLEDITLPDRSSTEQLIAGCPALEELSLIECYWMNVETLCISSEVLQKLNISEGVEYDVLSHEDDYEYDDIGGQDVPNGCKVVITGTNLKSFTYTGTFANEYSFHSATSVIDASIRVQDRYGEMVDNYDWDSTVGSFVMDLLKDLQNVEKLLISSFPITALSCMSWGDLPLFSKLVELHVVSTTTRLTCEGLLAIIQNSPCLQVVRFNKGLYTHGYWRCLYALDPLPVLSRTQLKRIEINCYYREATEDELAAIKTLLQAAPAMEILYIGCSGDCYSPSGITGSKRFDNLYKIKNFPRRSVDCEIILKYMK